jgi:nicotinamidase-related amidase
MTHALIVIDAQNGFRNSHTEQVLPILVSVVAKSENPILFTRFINTSDSSFERFLKWKKMYGGLEIEIVPELVPFVASAHVFDKTGYSAMKNDLFLAALQKLGVDSIELCGFDTDACVLATALDAFEMGYRTFVRADCCASGGGDRFHQAGLEILKRNLGEVAVINRLAR